MGGVPPSPPRLRTDLDSFYYSIKGKIGPKFSHLLMVRLRGVTPPPTHTPPYPPMVRLTVKYGIGASERKREEMERERPSVSFSFSLLFFSLSLSSFSFLFLFSLSLSSRSLSLSLTFSQNSPLSPIQDRRIAQVLLPWWWVKTLIFTPW